jgi:hypothetical protein
MVLRPTLFQRAGVWVAWPDHFDWANVERDPRTLAIRMKANGFKRLCVKVHHGSDIVNDGFMLENSWLRPFHNRGIFVGGWGWLDTNPASEAAAASEAIKRLSLDFYVANAEKTHKWDEGGDPTRSRIFCERFRALRPKIPAGFSTYWGTTWKTLGSTQTRKDMVMDFVSWAAAGFKFMPQSYPNDFPVATVQNTMVHALKARWDKRVVHPTIGIYDGQVGRVSVEEYVRQLYAAKSDGFTVGYDVYNAENMTEHDFVVLGQEHKSLLLPARTMTAVR